MELFLVACYTALFVALLYKMPFFKKCGLGFGALGLFFLLKVVAALVYGYVHKIIGGLDTWSYVSHSRLIYDSFFIHPLYFLELTFGPNVRPVPDYLKAIVEPIRSWSDVRTYTVLRVNALIHFFSGGYYYVHAVFFAFFSMIGLVALFRVFYALYPQYRKAWAILLFLLPSIIFWLSGGHKESLSILCLGGILLPFVGSLHTGWTIKRGMVLILAFSFLFLLRFYLAFLLIPALCCWYWTARHPRFAFAKYVSLYLVGVSILVGASLLSERTNIFKKIATTNYYFVMYGTGNGDIPRDVLEPHWQSAFVNAPSGLWNALVRPYFWEGTSWRQTISGVDTSILFLFTVICLLFNRFRTVSHRPFLYFCLFFTLSYLSFIGLIVDNLGAIVRYRSVILPFWLAIFIVGMDWEQCLPSSLKRFIQYQDIRI